MSDIVCCCTSSSRLANWFRLSGTYWPPFHGCGLYRFQNWAVKVLQASDQRSHRPWPAWKESFTLLKGSFHMLSCDSVCCTNIPNALAASNHHTLIQLQCYYEINSNMSKYSAYTIKTKLHQHKTYFYKDLCPAHQHWQTDTVNFSHLFISNTCNSVTNEHHNHNHTLS